MFEDALSGGLLGLSLLVLSVVQRIFGEGNESGWYLLAMGFGFLLLSKL